MTQSPDALPPQPEPDMPPEPEGGVPQWLKRTGIYGFALAALSFVLWQVDARAVVNALSAVDVYWAIAAFLVLQAAQLISALRMRYYAHLRRMPMSFSYAVSLYYAGMFYNLALPGGVGGDGYKVWVLYKRQDCPIGEGMRVMLGERANGLLILMLLMFLLIPQSRMWEMLPMPELLLPFAAVVTLIGYRVGTRQLTGESIIMSGRAALYSLAAQGLSLGAGWCLLQGMGIIPTLQWDYIVMFLIAAVASILPITVGGMGLRELVFYTGALEMQLPVEEGIAFSLAFFVCYAAVALCGLLALRRL